MPYRIQAAGLCSRGLRRPNNEDNIYFNGKTLPANHEEDEFSLYSMDASECPVFAVFDGLGGEAAGEYASQIAADHLHLFLKGKKCSGMEMTAFIKKLCFNMNDAVCQYAREHRFSSIGTTAAALFFTERKTYAVNLGDSRIYRFTGARIKQLSVDHTNCDHRGMRYLSQSLGTQKWEGTIFPSIKEMRNYYTARYLICSDGLTDMLSDKEIFITANGKDIPQAMHDMKEKVFMKGARDNLTIILCDVQSSESNRFLHFWKGLTQ